MLRIEQHVAFVIEVQAEEKVYLLDGGKTPTELRRSEAEKLLVQIKRHCDNIASATIRRETKPVCSFCGRPWTEKDSQYNEGCCDEDLKFAPTEEDAS